MRTCCPVKMYVREMKRSIGILIGVIFGSQMVSGCGKPEIPWERRFYLYGVQEGRGLAALDLKPDPIGTDASLIQFDLGMNLLDRDDPESISLLAAGLRFSEELPKSAKSYLRGTHEGYTKAKAEGSPIARPFQSQLSSDFAKELSDVLVEIGKTRRLAESHRAFVERVMKSKNWEERATAGKVLLMAATVDKESKEYILSSLHRMKEASRSDDETRFWGHLLDTVAVLR